MPDDPRPGSSSAKAIGRSLRIYYGDMARTQRMDALNARFVSKGGLAFDIGAHVGDRTASFHRLGASVVALEPQPRVYRALRLIHGRTPGITLRCEAVGAACGEMRLHVNSRNPTVSTLSRAFIGATQGAREWQGQDWDGSVTVPVTTLDDLIAEHGVPDFIKIDIEGHEHAALLGLSHLVRALSFEFTTIQRHVARDCIERLADMGQYGFNLSLGEEHGLRHPDWIPAERIWAEVAALPDSANSGDIYAKRF
jgi:FkbM family methyltransferase